MVGLWILDERYHIKEETLRKGGMASVYQARDLETDQLVAIKFFDKSNISPELTTEAYQRELRSLEDLNNHDHIAKFFSFGNDSKTGNHYIVLEWLEDKLLDKVCGSNISSWDDFYIHFGRPILEALSFSHRREIIHRDIKPANVLFTPGGKLRLVDFGISKYKAYWGSSLTFCNWSSKPYSPPEIDNCHYVNTRDIYGFAALALACIEQRELDEAEDVLLLLKNHELEDSVSDTLQQCLNYNPEDRIQNIDELIDIFDRYSSLNNELNFSETDKCYIALTRTAVQQLQISTGLSDKTSIERQISRELNEACALERRSENSYNLLSVDHKYSIVVDESNSYFVLTHAVRVESWRLEIAREKNYCPKTNYLVCNPPSSNLVQASTIKFLDGLTDYEVNANERRQQIEEQRLIDSWRSLLRLQLDLEKIDRDDIEYDKFSQGDELIAFHVGAGDWDKLIGQERIIWIKDNKKLIITIDKVSTDTLYSLSVLDEDSIPITGRLSLDTQLQSIARKRQEEALDDVLYNRSNRADLRNLIFSPHECKSHLPVKIDEYFQPELDESKKNVVSAVMGMNDFLVVKGPPGTGKTKVIAEMVLQYLQANPGSKILISSQTHNALDNAIERIREVKGDDVALGAVRVGRRDDPRISASVKALLLDNLVLTWLKTIRAKSTQYLEGWAKEQGVDKKEVELGLAVRTVRQSRTRLDQFLDNRESIQNEIVSLEKSIREMKSKDIIPEELSVAEFNREKLLSNLRDIDNAIINARRYLKQSEKSLIDEFDGGDLLASLNGEELKEWEEEYLSGSANKIRCKDVIELLQDWYDRFGRTGDFNAAFMNDSSIVAATCMGIGLKAYSGIKFDLCIVDEASKATVMEALLPVVKSKKWVFVGDQAQLPPFVHEGAKNIGLLRKHNLNENDLKTTLMDILIERLPEKCVMSLDKQYRMRPEIGNLISDIFYQNTLETGRGATVNFPEFTVKKPITWYCTAKKSSRFESRDNKSYVNHLEVNQIADVLKRFNLAAKSMDRLYSVCVLSFYSSQKNALQRHVSRSNFNCDSLSISCDTVDAFQGREADICIISITRCNREGKLGFVDDHNRINVALSRGKEALVIVGDSRFCAHNGQGNPLTKVLHYIQNNTSDCALMEV